MGLRQYSMHPSQLLTIKERLFELSTKTAQKLAARALREPDPVRIRQMLTRPAPLPG
jgi:phosphoenolpyruvate-protein kinase (PTS system EI component)